MAAKKAEKPDETLSVPVLIRVSPTERDAFRRVAKGEDLRSLSAWIRRVCLVEARAKGEKV